MVPDLHMSQLPSDKKLELNFAVESCGKQTALKVIKSNQSKSLIPVVARKMQQTQQFKTFAPLESVQVCTKHPPQKEIVIDCLVLRVLC